MLRAVFAADTESERDTALLVRGLAGVDLDRSLVRAFVPEVIGRRARGALAARAVLPALRGVVELAPTGQEI
jgi:hypothetical protein